MLLPPIIILMIYANKAMLAFGSEYSSGGPALMILLFSSVAVVLNTSFGQLLLSRGLAWHRLACDILLSVIVCIAGILLIPAHREAGLATSQLLAYGLTSLMIGAFAFRIGILSDHGK
jgi:O-antigen/teichoic acid export membrane protein